GGSSSARRRLGRRTLRSRRDGSARFPRRSGTPSERPSSDAREGVTVRVYVIGAGPGDPRLLTLRGAELIASCPVVLYTGSLVPSAVIARARPGGRVLDSSGMTLDEIVAVMVSAREREEDVARVHTGD